MVTPDPKKNRRVALLSLAVAAGMVGLTFASVPLYRMFCQATGFAGTVQRAGAAPQKSTGKTIKIRFDANTAPSLAWNFHPAQLEMSVKLGEQAMAHYTARNMSNETLTGSAIFNVTPEQSGAFFDKIQCFCFTEQTLRPGEQADLPVVFFVDPDILDDPDARSIDTITLSYTFYPAGKPASVSQAEKPAATQAN